MACHRQLQKSWNEIPHCFNIERGGSDESADIVRRVLDTMKRVIS
jgi:hypothetical protein